MSVISNLFGRSPIRPMQKHMQVANACARALAPFLEAMAAGNAEAMEVAHREVDRLEHEADDLKHEIRSHLPQRLFMAVERRDMLEILDCQDSIADTAQDVAELASLREMRTPSALQTPLSELLQASLATCEQGMAVINELDELIETGFGRREIARVEVMIEKLGKLESEADERGKQACRALFAIENEIGVGSYFWYDLILWIGNLADHAERAGNRIRLLIAS